MKELFEFLINGIWWQVLLSIIGIAFVIRIVYEILTDK
jgi:hypothetical protein